MWKEHPTYVKDDPINKGWTSLLLVAILLDSALTYHLTWTQIEDSNLFATVDRLF